VRKKTLMDQITGQSASSSPNAPNASFAFPLSSQTDSELRLFAGTGGFPIARLTVGGFCL